MKIELNICSIPSEFNLAKKLTKDYMEWLGEDLCYQGIEKEMETFHIMYNKPIGAFIYVVVDGEIAGGVGVRKLENDICEMKRLFVYDKFRGQKLGLILCQKLIEVSKELGYQKMRLDTLPSLKSALKVYQNLGFYETSQYYNNPDERVLYWELKLT